MAPKKILVVDDTEATRYAIVRTLKNEGYEIIEAANGRDALSLVASEKPDLVTLDIHLPDILGFEVCRIIKMTPASSHIPVLQVSASYVTSKDRVHGLEGGADSYLTHPFEPVVLVATVRALLRARAVDDKLRVTQERLRVVLKNAPISMYALDLDLRYTWAYNVPEPLTPEVFEGHTNAEILSASETTRLDEAMRQTLDLQEGQRMTIDLRYGEGTRSYDFTLEPLRSSTGSVVGLNVSSIDVTERKRSEEAQRQAYEEAELANEAKSRFLANMSHEIRTPLGIIQGFADLAYDSEISAAERNNYLLTIKRNAHSLTTLLGEILDLSKIEAGKIELEMTSFSLTTLLSDLVTALQLQAKEKGVALTLEIEGSFPNLVETDSLRVRQVVLNLIGNALKFTERGGIAVVARVARQEVGLPVLIEIEIRDSGIGLSPEQSSRLFAPFMQADNSTTRKYGGTGLGLNLSKRLAHALNGDLILASSALGEGSVFKLTFEAGIIAAEGFSSAYKPRAERAEKAFRAEQGELEGLKVLVVEDSPDNQILISRYLRRTGAEIAQAYDGREGVEKAREGHFDVVLMDIQMPIMDGYEAVRLLRGENFETPIIALTAHAFKEERDRALSHGFSDYLVKPINPSVLVQTLKDVSGFKQI